MSTSEKEATMIYIKIDNDLFYDDAVVLVRSFYPRTEVTALKADFLTSSNKSNFFKSIFVNS